MKKLLGFFLAVVILVSPVLAAGGSTVVYITRTGECYHADGCRFLQKSKIEITLSDAVARGYRACKVCRPPSLDSELTAAAPEASDSSPSPAPSDTPSPSPTASPTPTAAPTPAPPRHLLQRRRRTLRPRHPAREAGCSGPPAVRPLRRASTRFPALSNAGSAGRRKSNKEQ